MSEELKKYSQEIQCAQWSGRLHKFFITVQLLWLQIHDSCGNWWLSLPMQAMRERPHYHNILCLLLSLFTLFFWKTSRQCWKILKDCWVNWTSMVLWSSPHLTNHSPGQTGSSQGPERGQRGGARGSVCRSGVDQYHCASLIILSLAALDQRSL